MKPYFPRRQEETHKLQERIGAQMIENAALKKALKKIAHILANGRNVGQNRITAALEAEEIATEALKATQ